MKNNQTTTEAKTRVVQALVRGYGSKTNEQKVLDDELVNAMADEIMLLIVKEKVDAWNEGRLVGDGTRMHKAHSQEDREGKGE